MTTFDCELRYLMYGEIIKINVLHLGEHTSCQIFNAGHRQTLYKNDYIGKREITRTCMYIYIRAHRTARAYPINYVDAFRKHIAEHFERNKL